MSLFNVLFSEFWFPFLVELALRSNPCVPLVFFFFLHTVEGLDLFVVPFGWGTVSTSAHSPWRSRVFLAPSEGSLRFFLRPVFSSPPPFTSFSYARSNSLGPDTRNGRLPVPGFGSC